MTIAIAIGLIGSGILAWWYLIDPIKGRLDRMAMIENDVRNLELHAALTDKAIMSHEDNIRAMQDKYGNHLNQHYLRICNLETDTFGQTLDERVEEENSDPGQLISLNGSQRANMGQ